MPRRTLPLSSRRRTAAPSTAGPSPASPRPTGPVRRAGRGALVLAAAVLLGLGGPVLQAPAAPPPPPKSLPGHRHQRPAYDRTSLLEARRVDRVPAPKLAWYGCGGDLRCATAKLPMDYDQPRGATTELALVKLPARKPSKRIGTLFLNPGGPGGSATELVSDAAGFLDPSLLDAFDIVGIDPRGVGYSDQVRCFADARTQAPSLKVLQSTPFPYGATQEKSYLAASAQLARGCSTTGEPLSASMSTAEVARDMDVLRRSVGDSKLNYLGFSYGTYLGEVYANLFPDRIRTMVLDGTIDPEAWVGRGSNRLIDERLGSAAGSWRALQEILRRCDKVGPRYCLYAAGDPVKNLAALADRLKKKPLVQTDPFSGDTYTLHYADLVGNLSQLLYSPTAPDDVTQVLSDTTELANEQDRPAARRTGAEQAELQAASARLAATLRTLDALRTRQASTPGQRRAFPYDNSLDAYNAVLCTDAQHPTSPQTWVRAGAADDKTSPYFGRLWDWASAACARSTWTATDEDAYRGPFTKRTANTVLIVGADWDPATPYRGAKAAAALMPTSRLLSADNWGHTSYGFSTCASDKIDTYLLTRQLPRRGLVCHTAYRPFSQPVLSGQARTARSGLSWQGVRLDPLAEALIRANGVR
ncbi:pimeloyl-ACP methyl ester carboxylesterase [Friedmanniella endophytica]|uniref:Pimeloyl-ACP methyl ester carboxylesterase n=1 Tax=Microlunatus kandeliicorticis TaxID=1759536 RepID=A0A7W3ITD4_9ACTN|nr:alpha/beta hydrolase [Microlunatus kandeliicorticis]MBA8794904.1 pimeloyl-ACP methyl ester carboxylesterase [Microlunatus kandeliicorticis]